MIVVPTEFAESRIRRNGAPARQWIAGLPRLIEELCRRWDVTLTGEGPRYGDLALVLPAEDCVLKVSWIDETSAEEALALRSWDGHGAVRLLAADPEHGALLLERLDADRTLESLPLLDAAEIAGGLIRRLAIPAPTGIQPAQAPDLQARQHAQGDPLPARWVEQATNRAADLTAEQHTLVHSDLHYGNVLAGAREPWLSTDPKPVAAAPERSVAELMWTRIDEAWGTAQIWRLFDTIVTAGGLDRDRALGWVVVRAVDYWLWGLANGLTIDPIRCRRLLEAVAN